MLDLNDERCVPGDSEGNASSRVVELSLRTLDLYFLADSKETEVSRDVSFLVCLINQLCAEHFQPGQLALTTRSKCPLSSSSVVGV